MHTLALILVASITFVWTTLPDAYANGNNVFLEPSTPHVHKKVTFAGNLFKQLRLEKDSQLVVQIVPFGLNTSDRLTVILAGAGNPAIRKVKQTTVYTFSIPETKEYTLSMMAMHALASIDAYIYVYSLSSQPAPSLASFASLIRDSYDSMRSQFMFTPFRVVILHCGEPNAFSVIKTSDIGLCLELVENLEAEGLSKANLFVFFHEMGHSLLRLWGYPNSDNEDDADEFATMFMILLNHKDAARAAAEWWQRDDSTAQAIHKLSVDDRHTLSPQRARNILRWLREPPDRLRKWQKLLVPNMQTEYLRVLEKKADTWIDQALIKKELTHR